MHQILSDSPEFCGTYYEKHLVSFFRTQCHTHTHRSLTLLSFLYYPSDDVFRRGRARTFTRNTGYIDRNLNNTLRDDDDDDDDDELMITMRVNALSKQR